MGIDRKDVRIVCHFNIPKSMEAFYQESGRAGRDQLPSKSLLYYSIDDYKRMEFIISNSEKKKQFLSSHDGSLKSSLADFNKMVLYCEGSDCRRKKILESFGEQVPMSLCSKSCDACEHPNLVAKYLNELSSVRQNKASHIFISSSLDLANQDQVSEFWNHDEASVSEEDISGSDDDAEVVNSLTNSKFLSKSRISDKIDLLLQAEEKYYQKKDSSKQNASHDKKAISEALREAGRQRLLNALKQTQQRLVNFRIEFEAAAAFLESECYKKYGKVAKTIYNSQMASTVRWLSTSSLEDIINRLHPSINCDSDIRKPNAVVLVSSSSLPDHDDEVQEPVPAEEYKEENHENGEFKSSVVPKPKLPSPPRELPPIPSFSQFVNREVKRGRPDPPASSTKRLPTKSSSDPAKKLRM